MKMQQLRSTTNNIQFYKININLVGALNLKLHKVDSNVYRMIYYQIRSRLLKITIIKISTYIFFINLFIKYIL